MIGFWRRTDADARIAIIGVATIIVVFIGGFAYLLQLAAHLDAMGK